MKPFSSEAGRFTVSMPGEPNQKAETIKTASGEIKVVGFQVEQEDGVYIVSYTDYAEKMVRASSPGKLLDEGVTGMVTGVNGTLLTSKKVTQDTFPAREFSCEPERSRRREGPRPRLASCS